MYTMQHHDICKPAIVTGFGKQTVSQIMYGYSLVFTSP